MASYRDAPYLCTIQITNLISEPSAAEAERTSKRQTDTSICREYLTFSSNLLHYFCVVILLLPGARDSFIVKIYKRIDIF